MAHLGIDDRHDPLGAGAAVKSRNPVVIDVEVLADQLAQQRMRVADTLVAYWSAPPRLGYGLMLVG